MSGCGEDPGESQEAAQAPIPVQVAEVRQAPDTDDVTVYGIVRSEREGVLSFKTSGLIKSIAVDEGDRVAKGDILAELDMREIDADARRAAAAATKAKRDAERLKPLFEKGFASRQAIQDAETAYAQALSERTRVEFNRTLSRITAPADGVVLARAAEPNEIVNPGQPILTVSQGGGGFIMKAGLADRDVARIRIGAAARVTLDAFPDREIAGTVRRIAAASEARTGTFEVEIALSETPEGTASGFIGKARITPERSGGAPLLAVPASAILEGHGATANVYVVDEETMTVRQKRIGASSLSGDDVTVTHGLSEGDRVVSAGAPYLREGAKIRIVNDLKAARAAPAAIAAGNEGGAVQP
ncbi:efflux RND transporter periplasmic adaptor subunit [Parvibaculum sp.]|uniref:efflux RND transporter periplasmic adaptor subunit n=1 Tax=Parvibaculum sp. TaxID=2024848 RepID=UPI0025F9461C|nr:efflux RND transporter periplasmic adaptor subunit [Parvibaculum sp.]